MKIMNYDVFMETYKPQKNKVEPDSAFDGHMYETYGIEYNKVFKTEPLYVWTLIEEDGMLFIVPGLKFVNRLGYFITEKSWGGEKIIVTIDEIDDDYIEN